MKLIGMCVAACAFAAVVCPAAWAETEAEYATPAPHAVLPPLAPRAPARASYAADSAKTAARLPVEVREERAFIRSAAASARFQAEASRLALTKARDVRVRAFATDLIARDKATSAELTYLLHVRGMAQPMMDNNDRKLLKALGKLAGTKFDRTYVDEVGLKQHREDIRQYEKISADARDPSLKAWVDRQLVTLRSHLLLAEQLASHEGRTQAMGAPPAARRSAQRVSGSSSR